MCIFIVLFVSNYQYKKLPPANLWEFCADDSQRIHSSVSLLNADVLL